MPIKICHVASAHDPFDGRIFERECTSLAKIYDVYLVIPHKEDVVRNDVHLLGVDIPEGRFSRQFYMGRIFKRMEEVDADVYHFHEPELLPLGLKMKKRGKKVIYDSHENTPAMILNMRYLPKWIRKIASPLYEKYENYALKKFDGVISVDPKIVERLKKNNPNTVMVTNYPKYKEIETKEKRANSICFTGAIGPNWLVDNIVKSVKDIDVNVILAGFTSDEYLDKLKELSSWNKVEYKGIVPHQSALDIQRTSFAAFALLDYGVIVGGKWGTLGNTKLFEYMMAGTPLICTDFILWKEILDKYKCGICVNPHKIEEISNAIRYLQTHPNEAKIMGENGKRASKEYFNWSTQETILLDFYKETVGI